MMDNVSPSHHEGSVSPSQPHIFSSVKHDSSDCWNPQVLHSSNGMVSENFSTFAHLEPVYPDTPYASASHGPQYYTYANASSCSQFYPCSNMQEDSNLFMVQPALYRDVDFSYSTRDEGLGTSPSSFNSSSPPLNLPTTVTDQPPVSLSSANNFDCQRTNERICPEDIAYEEYPPPPPECGNCGCRMNVTWYTNHYLCGSCYAKKAQGVVVHQPDDGQNDRKRKRSATVNKKENQACTNCGTTRTTLWRRSSNGSSVCNACGLYEKLHKTSRPVSMRKDNIQTRKRKPKVPQNRQRKKSPTKAQSGIQRVPQPSNNLEQYPLPTCNSIQTRNLHLNPIRNTEPLPPINGSSFYPNYRPDMYSTLYHSVPPNEIINSARVLTPSNTSSPAAS